VKQVVLLSAPDRHAESTPQPQPGLGSSLSRDEPVTSAAFAASGLPSINSKAPIAIDADSLEVLQKDQLALFSGNVVATQADTQIRANTMKVFYGGVKSANTDAPKISKIEVNGNVFIKMKAETAQGGKGVYDVSSGIITLTGDVVLTKDKNIIKGGSLLIDMNKGTSKIVNEAGANGATGRVRGLFTPQ
jgi:lipopolysaccharide export system protein LptA